MVFIYKFWKKEILIQPPEEPQEQQRLGHRWSSTRNIEIEI